MHYKSSLQGILTICRKAGKLAMGLEPTKTAIQNGSARGILVSVDAAARSKKEAAFLGKQANIFCMEIPFTKVEIGQWVGRAAGVLAICDDGFSGRVQQIMQEMQKMSSADIFE